jgi:hypothetical protein
VLRTPALSPDAILTHVNVLLVLLEVGGVVAALLLLIIVK